MGGSSGGQFRPKLRTKIHKCEFRVEALGVTHMDCFFFELLRIRCRGLGFGGVRSFAHACPLHVSRSVDDLGFGFGAV